MSQGVDPPHLEADDSVPSLVSWTHVPRMDASAAPSMLRDTDQPRRKRIAASQSSHVLFWIKNCVMQWKFINAQVEAALKKRKQRVQWLTPIDC